MANDDSENRVVELLEQAVNLLGILVTRGSPDSQATQSEHILLLASAGLQPKSIADLLGTTPATVSVRLSEAKKNKLGRKKRA